MKFKNQLTAYDFKKKLFHIRILKHMTIDQLDLLKTLTKKITGKDIDSYNFQYSYFLKTFSTELSQHNYENDDHKRLEILSRLYKFSSSRKFSQSLTFTLLEEMLMHTIKIDQF